MAKKASTKTGTQTTGGVVKDSKPASKKATYKKGDELEAVGSAERYEITSVKDGVAHLEIVRDEEAEEGEIQVPVENLDGEGWKK